MNKAQQLFKIAQSKKEEQEIEDRQKLRDIVSDIIKLCERAANNGDFSLCITDEVPWYDVVGVPKELGERGFSVLTETARGSFRLTIGWGEEKG